MKKAPILAAALALALAACNQEPASSPTGQAPDASPAAVAGAPAAAPTQASAQGKVDVAGIEASGKTGLWAEPAGVCAKGSKDGVLIAWNVKDSGAAKVDVNVLTKEGDERNFAKGGPIGGKNSGRWVRPGRIFKVRDAATGDELGTVTIEETQC